MHKIPETEPFKSLAESPFLSEIKKVGAIAIAGVVLAATSFQESAGALTGRETGLIRLDRQPPRQEIRQLEAIEKKNISFLDRAAGIAVLSAPRDMQAAEYSAISRGTEKYAKVVYSPKPIKTPKAAKLRLKQLRVAQEGIDNEMASAVMSVSRLGNKTPEESLELIKGTGLKTPEQLPGANIKFSKEQAKDVENYKDSYVTIYRSEKGKEIWYAHCSGNRVNFNGKNNIVTMAGHCADGDKKDKEGEINRVLRALSPEARESLHEGDAVDILPLAKYDYAIFSPGDEEPIGKVEAMSLRPILSRDESEIGENDRAILSIKPLKRKFNTLAAIDISKVALPTPGEAFMMYSGNTETGFDPIQLNGVYLGVGSDWVRDSAGITRQSFILAGFRPKNEKEDTCLGGASGVAGFTASGGFTGSAFYRFATRYSMSGKRYLNSPMDSSRSLRWFEQGLNTKIFGEFPVVCAFALNSQAGTQKLVEGLSKPINTLGAPSSTLKYTLHK